MNTSDEGVGGVDISPPLPPLFHQTIHPTCAPTFSSMHPGAGHSASSCFDRVRSLSFAENLYSCPVRAESSLVLVASTSSLWVHSLVGLTPSLSMTASSVFLSNSVIAGGHLWEGEKGCGEARRGDRWIFLR